MILCIIDKFYNFTIFISDVIILFCYFVNVNLSVSTIYSNCISTNQVLVYKIDIIRFESKISLL